jgi:serine/threonine-protein kinase
MAPEYIEDDRVHPKGDLYALGALTFHMLTGAPPFEGKAAEVLTKHVMEDPPKPSSRRQLPGWCDEAVRSLMAKAPDDRPGAYQIVQFLEDAVGRKLEPPRLLGIDARGEVVRPSRLPFYVALAGGGVLTLGVGFVALTVMFVAVWWVASSVPDLVAAEPPRELAPLPGAELPVAAPAGSEPPTVAPAPTLPAPAPTPVPAPRAAKPAPAAPPAPDAATTVRVRSNRRVLVYVDDVAVGYTPLDHAVTPGAHEVSALVPGQPSTRQDRQLRIDRGGEPTVEFQF